jgi:hypothetical protein
MEITTLDYTPEMPELNIKLEITTLACPPDMSDPNIDPATAPIWVDAEGNQYMVASGYLDGEYETSDPILAEPDRINAVVGMMGLDALAAMGLVPSEVVLEDTE